MADDHERELAREMGRRGYSRRQILKYGLGMGLSATGLSALLAACGQSPQPQTTEGQSAAQGTVAAPAAETAAPIAETAAPAEAPAAATTGTSMFNPSDFAEGPWPQPAVSEPSSRVEISVAHAWDAVFMERQNQFDQLFMERHPNIAVKAENTPWGDFLQKYLAQIAGGAAPDLLYVHFSWAQNLIKQGTPIELDTYINGQADFNLDDFTKPSLVSYQRDGKLWGVPYDEGPGILYYNADLFDEAGLSYPDESWTVENLREAAKTLTKGEGASKVFGLAATPTPGDAVVAPAYLYPFGAAYVNEPEETQCVINSAEALEAFEWWMAIRFEDGSVPSPADQQTMAAGGDPFQFGRVAMKIDGSWATPGINQNAKFKWDVAPWPKGPDKQSTFSAGSCYMISKASANPDSAWIYLNDYISTAGQIYMWGSTGRGSPSRNSAWESYLNSDFAPPNAKIIQDALNSYASHDILDQPTAARVTQVAGPIWDLVVNEQLGIKEALDRVCQEIDPILAENAA
jgi:multiple sugar transport system substrate-binding protein